MDEIKHRDQVDMIREVFYYQSRFDDKTIVLKIDYRAQHQAQPNPRYCSK